MGIHLDHVSLLVKDLDAAEADWTRILEALSPGHTMQITRGEGLDETDGTPMRWLTFQNPDPRGVSIQLWSPAEPGHWPDKVLERRGEYVHHLAFCSDDFDGMIDRVRDAGLPLVLDEASHPNTQPWLRWNFLPPIGGPRPADRAGDALPGGRRRVAPTPRQRRERRTGRRAARPVRRLRRLPHTGRDDRPHRGRA